jgi:PAS domain S-box-containing protein
MVMVSSIAGIFFGFFFGIIQFLQGAYLLTSIDAVVVAVLTVNALVLHFWKRIHQCSLVILVTLGAFFMYLLITGGVSGTGIVWSFLYPVGVSFILGFRGGLLVSAAYLGIAVSYLFWPAPLPGTHEAGIDLKGRFVAVYGLSTFISLYFAYIQETAIQRLRREIRIREQLSGRLAHATEYSQMLFSVVPAAVITVDMHGIVTSMNPHAEDVVGIRASEIIGKPCMLWDNGIFEISETSHGTEIFRNRRIVLQRESLRIPVLMNASHLLGENGERIGIVVSFQDVQSLAPTEEQQESPHSVGTREA